MKVLFLCLLLTTTVVSIAGFADPNAVRLTFNRSFSGKCEKTESVCKDCSTIAMCSALSPDPIGDIPCTAPNKYCVDGACTSIPPTLCQTGSSSFKCTDVGIFPDPSDCTKYHICNRISSVPYQCNAGFVFNSKLKMCQMGKTPCSKISCSKASEANTIIPYASNPAYYALCLQDTAGFSTLMFKCKYSDFEEFDAKSKTCKFKCKTRGNFQDPNDCNKHFYCSGVNAQPISEKCPEKWVFDGKGCNEAVDKCEHKPQLDQDIIDLVVRLQDKIIEKICELLTKPITCLTDIDAKKFKVDVNGDIIDYTISVNVPGTSDFYHVKISSDIKANTEEVKSAAGPKKEDDDFE